MVKNTLILLLAVFLNSCSNGQKAGETSLSAVAFQEKIHQNPQAVILDVRTPGEFEKGHLEHAINIDWNGNDFDSRISELDKSQPVFVYCLSGGRSADAADKMRQQGFTKVYEMPGGMMEWRSEQFPEVRKSESIITGMSRSGYEALLKSDKLVLVDFYAEWCGPCKRMKPFLERIATDMEETILLVHIDVDKNPDISNELQITSIPELKLYQSGKLVWKHTGYINEERLRESISKHL